MEIEIGSGFFVKVIVSLAIPHTPCKPRKQKDHQNHKAQFQRDLLALAFGELEAIK